MAATISYMSYIIYTIGKWLLVDSITYKLEAKTYCDLET